jgi:hypothetical protein
MLLVCKRLTSPAWYSIGIRFAEVSADASSAKAMLVVCVYCSAMQQRLLAIAMNALITVKGETPMWHVAQERLLLQP